MIKNIKIELVIIGILILNIFLSTNIDIGLNKAFKNFDGLSNNIYLKSFFTNITELGDSLWFFLLSLLGYIFCIFFKKGFQKKISGALEDCKTFFLFLFFSILLTGVLTQIIKHVIGRPRPNYASKNSDLDISLFNFESAFHSFPSGHTSTIFVVALSLSLITPKIKYFYLLYAGIIGFSRVVVGAHYFTDILGGIAVAFVGYKATLYLFKKILKKNTKRINYLNNNFYFLFLVILFIAIVFISVGSGLDIFISSLFYQGNQNFSLQSFYFVTIAARKFFLPCVILYLLLFPFISMFISIKKIYFNYEFVFKEVLFVFTSVLLNNVIIVNLLLKNLWGRARPNDILQLGGGGSFTPWFKYSNACESNCSFVSGDTSVGFSIIILYFLTKNINYLWLALFSGFFLGVIRIMEGGHFLSDVLLSCFLIFVLSFLQYYFYKIKF